MLKLELIRCDVVAKHAMSGCEVVRDSWGGSAIHCIYSVQRFKQSAGAAWCAAMYISLARKPVSRSLQACNMASLSTSRSSLLRMLSTATGRRQIASLGSAAVAGKSNRASGLLRSSQACRRAPLAVRRLAAVPGTAVVCSAADDGACRRPWLNVVVTGRMPAAAPTNPKLLAGLAGLVEVQLKVDGMVCEGCSSRVEEALQKMAGVKKVQQRAPLLSRECSPVGDRAGAGMADEPTVPHAGACRPGEGPGDCPGGGRLTT